MVQLTTDLPQSVRRPPATSVDRRARLADMTSFTMHCPRCKETFSTDDADVLADALVDHVEREHGHAPPREHVLARIERQNAPD
jgi:uncharacterized C2H2 Zn-finger protein